MLGILFFIVRLSDCQILVFSFNHYSSLLGFYALWV